MKKNYLFAIFVLLTSFSTNRANAACTANFSYSNVANVFTFTDASTTTSGSVVGWAWNFGDLSAPSNLQNPTHTYTVCGVYTVSLTIATSAFCSNTYSTTITVNSGMAGTFTSTVDSTTGVAIFQGSPLGLNVNYAWNYGDGNTGTGAVATNTYASSGTYYVCLTVSDTGGICTNTYCDSVVVYIATPSCSSIFTYTDNGSGNLTFQVTPLVITDTYAWDYGDGTTGTLPISLHMYPLAGTYYVCLTTTDPLTSCTSTFCDSVIAAGSACAVSYTYLDVNGFVAFTALPPSTTGSYAWTFGDGNTGTGVVTTNTYSSSGSYYACVTLTDAFNSCTVNYCDSVITNITGIGIKENENDLFGLIAFPNPTQNQLTIEYSLNKSSNVRVELLDLIGNKISEQTISQSAGKHQTNINTENLSKGAYLIKLSSEIGNSSKLIIKN
ncbi:hypothetical protein BH10BAC1_BH10BAC1_01160 [soil metagenome]